MENSTPQPQGDSLTKRYGYKVASNLGALVTNVGSQVLIVRGLGPHRFGDYSFLTGAVQLVVDFVEAVSSMFFSTQMAQHPGDRGLVRLQLTVFAVCAACGCGVLLLAGALGLLPTLFPAQQPVYVWMAAASAILLWLPQLLSRMADAYGLTVAAERRRMVQRVVGFGIIAALAGIGMLNLTSVFCYNYIISAGFAVALWRVCRRAVNAREFGLAEETVHDHTATLRHFLRYAAPLIALSLAALAAGFADRWMLQRTGASVEQAYYGLGSQVAAVCFLFTGAMVPLLTREFSILQAETESGRLARSFCRYVPMFYSLAAFFSCFIAAHARAFVGMLGGPAYQQAVPAVAIMAVYPIHQTYGQMTGALLFATGRTRLYTTVGVAFLLLGIPATYWLLPMGAGWGAGGVAATLALKMVIMQVVPVNLLLFYSARMLHVSYRGLLVQQFSSTLLLLVLAFGSRLACTTGASDAPVRTAVTLAGSGLLYLCGCVACAWFRPAIFGLTADDVRAVRRILNRAEPFRRSFDISARWTKR